MTLATKSTKGYRTEEKIRKNGGGDDDDDNNNNNNTRYGDGRKSESRKRSFTMCPNLLRTSCTATTSTNSWTEWLRLRRRRRLFDTGLVKSQVSARRTTSSSSASVTRKVENFKFAGETAYKFGLQQARPSMCWPLAFERRKRYGTKWRTR